MTQIAQYIDVLLYALVAVTVGLILYKTLDLWWPRALGRQVHAVRLGQDDRAIEEGLESLESGLTALAVIASTAPFVGLAGTVIHIMDALRVLGTAGAELSLISGPVVTALNATLVGLASAIPAAAAHAVMLRRLQVLENRQRRLWPSA